jgi:hypothetical protein
MNQKGKLDDVGLRAILIIFTLLGGIGSLFFLIMFDKHPWGFLIYYLFSYALICIGLYLCLYEYDEISAYTIAIINSMVPLTLMILFFKMDMYNWLYLPPVAISIILSVAGILIAVLSNHTLKDTRIKGEIPLLFIFVLGTSLLYFLNRESMLYRLNPMDLWIIALPLGIGFVMVIHNLINTESVLKYRLKQALILLFMNMAIVITSMERVTWA